MPAPAADHSERDAELRRLLIGCGNGDQQAFAELYRAAASKLYALCRQMLRRDDLAEDVLQESFAQIWRDAARYKADRSAPLTWMGVIVRHRCIDLLRRQGRHASQSLDEAMPAEEPMDQLPGPLELTQRWAENQRLGRCLNQLSESQRVSITLAFYRGYSHSQLSDHLATPVGTIKSWIRRGLKQLQGCLHG